MSAPRKPRTRRIIDPSARAKTIARGLVEGYLADQGGEELGWTLDEREERLVKRIAQAIERAAGGR